MLKNTVVRALGAVSVAAAAALLPSAAQAIVYVGTFDPVYSSGSDYSFKGTATFDVPNPCISGASGINFVANNSDSCGFMNVLSASLTIYKTLNPGDQVTHTMAPLGDNKPDLPYVYGVQFTDGAITGAITNYFGGVSFQLDPHLYDSGFDFDETLWMRFFLLTGDTAGSLIDPVDLCTAGQSTVPGNSTGVGCGGTFNSGFQSNPATNVTFTAVPEPAGLLLTGAALALCLGATRRRRSKPA